MTSYNYIRRVYGYYPTEAIHQRNKVLYSSYYCVIITLRNIKSAVITLRKIKSAVINIKSANQSYTEFLMSIATI